MSPEYKMEQKFTYHHQSVALTIVTRSVDQSILQKADGGQYQGDLEWKAEMIIVVIFSQ